MLAAGTFLLFQGGGAAEPERVALTTAPKRATVLTDAEGTVLEEFTGDCAAGRSVYLCERVRAELLAADRTLLNRGNLTIRTAIDPRAQRAAQQAIDRYVHRDDPHVAAQAMVVPGTGEIRALATSHGNAPGLQQGSTAMVHTLAAALEGGLRYADGFPYAARCRAPAYSAFRNCNGETIGDPAHTVVNDGSGHRGFTALEGVARTPFTQPDTARFGGCRDACPE